LSQINGQGLANKYLMMETTAHAFQAIAHV